MVSFGVCWAAALSRRNANASAKIVSRQADLAARPASPAARSRTRPPSLRNCTWIDLALDLLDPVQRVDEVHVPRGAAKLAVGDASAARPRAGARSRRGSPRPRPSRSASRVDARPALNSAAGAGQLGRAQQAADVVGSERRGVTGRHRLSLLARIGHARDSSRGRLVNRHVVGSTRGRAVPLSALGARLRPACSRRALIGRLPQGMSSLAILLLVRAHTGSYAGRRASRSARMRFATAAGAPFQGRLVDRFGRGACWRRARSPRRWRSSALVAGGRTPAPARSCWSRWRRLAGGLLPPIAPSVRALLREVCHGPEVRETAYALESVDPGAGLDHRARCSSPW